MTKTRRMNILLYNTSIANFCCFVFKIMPSSAIDARKPFVQGFSYFQNFSNLISSYKIKKQFKYTKQMCAIMNNKQVWPIFLGCKNGLHRYFNYSNSKGGWMLVVFCVYFIIRTRSSQLVRREVKWSGDITFKWRMYERNCVPQIFNTWFNIKIIFSSHKIKIKNKNQQKKIKIIPQNV